MVVAPKVEGPRIRPRRLTAACGLVESAAGAVPSPSPTLGPGPGVASGFDFKAMNHVSWWHDGYAQADAADARRALTATRSTWGGVLVTWYMDRPRLHRSSPRTPSRRPRTRPSWQAIQDLHALGLKVMLKPHVDVKDGSWRGTIRPSDNAAWFSSYDAFMTRYAALAQAQRVELLDVGTELVTMSDYHFVSEWATVIGHVRAAYTGPLTYGANANSPGDEFTSVSFWSLLDYAGLDVYAPLTEPRRPDARRAGGGLEPERQRRRHGRGLQELAGGARQAGGLHRDRLPQRWPGPTRPPGTFPARGRPTPRSRPTATTPPSTSGRRSRPG